MSLELTEAQQKDYLIKSYCLDKAVEAFKYNQSIPVLELAKEMETYLTTQS